MMAPIQVQFSMRSHISQEIGRASDGYQGLSEIGELARAHVRWYGTLQRTMSR